MGMSRALFAGAGFPNPIWTMRPPRNWFPSRAGQLGREEVYRRMLGSREDGSKMPDRYDRTERTTELRTRNSILKIAQSEGWAPTGEYDVAVRESRLAPVAPDASMPDVSMPDDTPPVTKLGAKTPPAEKEGSDEEGCPTSTSGPTRSLSKSDYFDGKSEIDITELDA